jgi:hypothetical protein
MTSLKWEKVARFPSSKIPKASRNMLIKGMTKKIVKNDPGITSTIKALI